MTARRARARLALRLPSFVALVATLIATGGTLGCGRYGPPVRGKPADSAPKTSPASPETSEDGEPATRDGARN